MSRTSSRGRPPSPASSAATSFGRAQLDCQVIGRFRPRYVAFVGVTTYRVAFDRQRAVVGPQPERIEGAAIWLLPNPSGLNAHYQLPDLIPLYRELREAAFGADRSGVVDSA